MATVTIGGQERLLRPLGFKGMRQAAPHIDKAQSLSQVTTLTEVMEGNAAVLYVFAISIDGPFRDPVELEASFQALESALTGPESLLIPGPFRALLNESGFGQGEDEPAETADRNAEPPSSSTQSSSNSSPPASAEATGIA